MHTQCTRVPSTRSSLRTQIPREQSSTRTHAILSRCLRICPIILHWSGHCSIAQSLALFCVFPSIRVSPTLPLRLAFAELSRLSIVHGPRVHMQAIATPSGCHPIILPAPLVRPAHDSLIEVLCVCAREACDANGRALSRHPAARKYTLCFSHSSLRLSHRGAVAFFPSFISQARLLSTPSAPAVPSTRPSLRAQLARVQSSMRSHAILCRSLSRPWRAAH
ncbi:hypothetical protein K466DRAFT_607775 [Polyporus arcularius HHB13444]|uniref:Uncharacterized protein n=1 Tax=Polyporus arcularius HHB13444 TaxID=1314778 RepID=A0A5C3NM42_9APHY|nr:hypothetical protein K466DRAFT_607775 [Polyporus arcularius HHB13444]